MTAKYNTSIAHVVFGQGVMIYKCTDSMRRKCCPGYNQKYVPMQCEPQSLKTNVRALTELS